MAMFSILTYQSQRGDMNYQLHVDAYDNHYAVFELDNSHQKAFMSVKRTNHLNERRAVVMVDAEKFLKLWQAEVASIHSFQSHGTPDTWKADRKYHLAADGFSKGIDNPVPLAYVSCLSQNVPARKLPKPWWRFWAQPTFAPAHRLEYVAFTNGVTRTIWLLANGFSEFPVECSCDEASRLRELAGTGAPFKTVEELTA